MKLIELHILQSFPVSCLNRDDVGAPKTATFGGVTRARLSSQCLKRAARLHAKESFPDSFQGIRSRLIVPQLEKALGDAGAEKPRETATEIAKVVSKIDSKNKSGDEVTTAVFLSPGEIKQIAEAVAGGTEIKKAVKNAKRLDAADIALFGRMIANDSSLGVEAAAMFSHALSTHRSENDLDFFSAVDEVKAADEESEDAGAGMIGTLEFASACYYRFCALNLDMLASNLDGMDSDQLRKVVATFLRSVIEAVPGARKATMNANVLPGYVLGVFKSQGQPVQLVNAFENPLRPKGSGLMAPSIDALQNELASLKKTWGIQTDTEIAIPDDGGIDDFIKTLSAHVS